MIQDILDLLVLFIRRDYYSLLNKKCRDTYFKKYGVLIKKLQLPRSELLIKYHYKINFGMFYYGISCRLEFLENYSGEERNIVINNCRSIIGNLQNSSILELFDIFPKIIEFRANIIADQLSNDAISFIVELSKKKNFYDLGLSLIFESIMINPDEDYIKKIEKIRCNKISTSTFWGVPSYLDLIITEARIVSSITDGDFPELRKLIVRPLDATLNIKAPKLEEIECADLCTTWAIVKKYRTIKTINNIYFIDMKNSGLKRAYINLSDYKFDLRYQNGVMMPKNEFEELIDLEKRNRERNPNIYRSLEALLDFVPSNEHWLVFDLSKITTISVD